MIIDEERISMLLSAHDEGILVVDVATREIGLPFGGGKMEIPGVCFLIQKEEYGLPLVFMNHLAIPFMREYDREWDIESFISSMIEHGHCSAADGYLEEKHLNDFMLTSGSQNREIGSGTIKTERGYVIFIPPKAGGLRIGGKTYSDDNLLEEAPKERELETSKIKGLLGDGRGSGGIL